MPTVTMRLDITPTAKARVAQNRGQRFKARRDVSNEATIAALAAAYRPAEPIEGPVLLRIVAVLPRSKGMATISKRTGLPLHEAQRYPHTKKPDGDNLAKALLDALKSWWRDDSQVWDHHVIKLVAAMGEQPHWLVTVEW